MKRKGLLIIGCLMVLGLTACQKSTVSESCWNSAKQADSLSEYVKEHAAEMDVEALKAEAESADSTLSQQYKATALLCMLEDQKEEGYSVSASYAAEYLSKVNTDGEDFWKSMEESFYPYDGFGPMLAAAGQLDEQTLVNLISGIPADKNYGNKLKDAVDQYIRENPGKTAAFIEELEKIGYFETWSLDDWKGTYLYSYVEPYLIQADTAADAVSYVSHMRNAVLPLLESKFGREEFQQTSELTEEGYYATNLAVTIEEDLQLKEPEESTIPETIELENKKVAAFYRNPHTEEFKNSPPRLRLLGDFMLELSEEEFPQSLEEADYYLVLTPSYEYGDFYTDNSGNETKIQEVYSITSIDLYEAKTGTFLRHLGDVAEDPDSRLFRNLSEEAAEYPAMTGADVLSFIYHHVNEPDAYAYLMDHTSGKSELEAGEAICMGNWEITYHSASVVKEFDSGMFRFTADEGFQFVKGEFTIKNVGAETDTFLPTVYYIDEDPIVRITDANRENYYDSVNAMSDSRCLSSTSLEPGESKDGEIIFQVPDEVALGDEPLYVEVSLKNRSVCYVLNR